MKNNVFKTRRFGALNTLLAVLFSLLTLCMPLAWKTTNDGGRYALTAAAGAYDDFYDDPVIEVLSYSVEMDVRKDRSISVQEKITVKFLDVGLTMFYRSLPIEGARYRDFHAACEGNDEFEWYVADNPDMDGFIDVNCVGNADFGKTWTYDISYVMQEDTGNTSDGMRIDVIGFGWTVVLNDVSVVMRFPASLVSEPKVYVGYGNIGADGKATYETNADNTELAVYAPCLHLAPTDTYDEVMAEGITVEFDLPKGTLENYTKTLIATEDMWKIVLGGVAIVGIAIAALLLTRKKHELITVVNVTAPDAMDPMTMGKRLDGVIDTEDITSMVYYFAYKGYLAINLEDEDDPILLKKVARLPETALPHEKTLFNGLFKSGDSVHTSDLEYKFFEAAEKAKLQTPHVKMYNKKSVLGYILGGVVGVLYAFLVPFLMGLNNVGGGYLYGYGAVLFAPIAVILFLGYISENYRYKWKPSKRRLMYLAYIVIAAITLALFTWLFAPHFMTKYEKLVTCVFALVPSFITLGAISREEAYLKSLGDILGFKEFIVYTEEDKIKTMLETEPELYYKVLPYAQVLGVTDEWEGKFANILLPPPSWCTGYGMSTFDCFIMHRCMTRAFVTAMRPPRSQGGSGIGRSGGGGSFGGFGGGGFGGGGGGAR